jgi:hypothetical protein
MCGHGWAAFIGRNCDGPKLEQREGSKSLECLEIDVICYASMTIMFVGSGCDDLRYVSAADLPESGVRPAIGEMCARKNGSAVIQTACNICLVLIPLTELSKCDNDDFTANARL